MPDARDIYRRLTLRELIIAAAMVFFCAYARGTKPPIVLNNGQDLITIGPAPADFDPEGDGPSAYGQFGVRYNSFDPFRVDFWHWDVHLIYFVDNGTTVRGSELTEEEMQELDVSLPWRFRVPVGFVALIGLLWMFLVGRRGGPLFAFIASGGFLVGTAGFLAVGFSWACILPALLALYHLSIGISAMLGQRKATPAEEPAARRPSLPVREPARQMDAGPFRSPPRAAPIVVHRPSTAPANVPVERDENAAKPTLLG